MTEKADHILNEYEEAITEQSGFYYPAIFLICFFICFGAVDMVVDVNRLTLRRFEFDWFTFIMTIVIPVIGLIFTFVKTKVGWIISTLYFSFLSAAAIVMTILEITRDDSAFRRPPLDLRQGLILIVALSISFLFQTKTIRLLFRISNLVWIITTGISIFFVVLLILFG